MFGIDAANREIGCRPETFAVEFHYLRGITPMQDHGAFFDRSTTPHIYATYHTGEDFLDNVVWLLFRSEELGIAMEPQLRSQLESLADKLFLDVYRDLLPANRYQYYCSMQLRGDAPELYFYYTLPYRPPDRITSTLREHYDAYRIQASPKLAAFRNSPQILRLCQCYHYDPACRERGLELYEYTVEAGYLSFIRQMQDSLAQSYAALGLMIECNPTSNYLIGTFQRYDQHPIFRFNNARLIPVDGSFTATPQLSVSVNTDDLGVFDTTLENEYAILASSLERMIGQDGKRCYTSDSIYQYLDNLRQMGLEQSFLLRTSQPMHLSDAPRQHRSSILQI